jgi:predicted ribonuclease toxin of YeeF-YezG toxin-antitoxin module
VKAQESTEAKLKEAQDALAAETLKRLAAEDEVKVKVSQTSQDKDYYRDRMSSQEKEIKDLLVRLNKSDQERTALTHQVCS